MITPFVTATQYERDRGRELTVSQLEERALFLARRAVATATFNQAFVETLRQLAQSDREAIRNHAVLLAHQAAAIDWACRQNRGGDAA